MLTNCKNLFFKIVWKIEWPIITSLPPLNAAEIIRWFSMQTFTSTEKEFSTWSDSVKKYILPNVWK